MCALDSYLPLVGLNIAKWLGHIMKRCVCMLLVFDTVTVCCCMHACSQEGNNHIAAMMVYTVCVPLQRTKATALQCSAA